MTLVRRLYGQFRHLIHEGAKFLVVGGIGWVVTNAAYGLLRHLAVGPITATTIATIIATVVTYVGNRYWSFRHRERAGVAREGIVFLVLNGVGLLIQDAFVGFNYYALGLGHNRIAQFAALNIGIGVATVFRFWSYRRWVWAAPAGGADGASGEPGPSSAPGGTAVPAEAPVPSTNGHDPAGNGMAGNGRGHRVNGDGREAGTGPQPVWRH